MKLELAKKLKDAGFPSKCWEITECVGADCHELTPTLSELIEACGEEFLSLVLTGFSELSKWRADGGEDRGTHSSYQQYGATPEEAVANLWIALNTL